MRIHKLACACACIRECTHSCGESNTCASPKLIRIPLTRSAWLFNLRSVATCSFILQLHVVNHTLFRVARTIAIHECTACASTRVRTYSRVTCERLTSAVKLLVVQYIIHVATSKDTYYVSVEKQVRTCEDQK